MTRPIGLSTRVVALGPILTQWRDASRAYADLLQDSATDRFLTRLQLCEWRVDNALHALLDRSLRQRHQAPLLAENRSDKMLPTRNAVSSGVDPILRSEPKDFPFFRPSPPVTQSIATQRSNRSASDSVPEVRSNAAPKPRGSRELASSFALPPKGQATPDRVRSYLQQMVPPGTAAHEDGIRESGRASELRNRRRTAIRSAHELADREGKIHAFESGDPDKSSKSPSLAKGPSLAPSPEFRSTDPYPSVTRVAARFSTRKFAYHSPHVAENFDEPRRRVVSEILAREQLGKKFDTQAAPSRSHHSDSSNNSAFQRIAPSTLPEGIPKTIAFSDRAAPTSSMDAPNRIPSRRSPVEPTRVDPQSTSKNPEFPVAIPTLPSSAFPDSNATQRSHLQRSQTRASGLSGLLDAWQSQSAPSSSISTTRPSTDVDGRAGSSASLNAVNDENRLASNLSPTPTRPSVQTTTISGRISSTPDEHRHVAIEPVLGELERILSTELRRLGISEDNV